MVKFSKLAKRVLTCVLAALTIVTSTPGVAFASEISEDAPIVEAIEDLSEEAEESIAKEGEEVDSEEEVVVPEEEISEEIGDTEEETETNEDAEEEEAADETTDATIQAKEKKYIVVSGEADDVELFTQAGAYPDNAKYLQKDITVKEVADKNYSLLGTLNYVGNYTAFDASAELQRGYYLVLHFESEVEGTSVYTKVMNATTTPDSEYPTAYGYDVTNDCMILRFGSKDELETKGFLVTAVNAEGEVVDTKKVFCNELTLNAPEITAEGVGDESIWGYSPAYNQYDIYVADEEDASYVYGGLSYYRGYTGFSSNPELQEGYYLGMHFETYAPKLYVKFIGNKSEMNYDSEYGYDISSDTDGNVVLRIANNKDAKEKGFELTMCDENGEVLGTKTIMCGKLELSKSYNATLNIIPVDAEGKNIYGLEDLEYTLLVNGKKVNLKEDGGKRFNYFTLSEDDEISLTVKTRGKTSISAYEIDGKKEDVENNTFTYKGVATKGDINIKVYGTPAPLKVDVYEYNDLATDVDAKTGAFVIAKGSSYHPVLSYDMEDVSTVSFDTIKVFEADGTTPAPNDLFYANQENFTIYTKATGDTYVVALGNMVNEEFVKLFDFKVSFKSEAKKITLMYNGKATKKLTVARGEYVSFSLKFSPEGATFPYGYKIAFKNSQGNESFDYFTAEEFEGYYYISALTAAEAGSYTIDFIGTDDKVFFTIPVTVTEPKLNESMSPVVSLAEGYEGGKYKFKIELPKGVKVYSENDNKYTPYKYLYTWGKKGEEPKISREDGFDSESVLTEYLVAGEGEYEFKAKVYIPLYDNEGNKIYESKTVTYEITNYYATKASDMKVTQKTKKAYTGQEFLAANIKYADNVTFCGEPKVYFENLSCWDQYEWRYDSATGDVYVTLFDEEILIAQLGKQKLTIEADAPDNAVSPAKKTITINILAGINHISLENYEYSIFKPENKTASIKLKAKAYYEADDGIVAISAKKVKYELGNAALKEGITVKNGKITIPKNYIPSADEYGNTESLKVNVRANDYKDNHCSNEVRVYVNTEKESLAEAFLVKDESGTFVRLDNTITVNDVESAKLVARKANMPIKNSYNFTDLVFIGSKANATSSNKYVKVNADGGLSVSKAVKSVTFTFKMTDGSKVSIKSEKYNIEEGTFTDFGIYDLDKNAFVPENQDIDLGDYSEGIFGFEICGKNENDECILLAQNSYKKSIKNGRIYDFGTAVRGQSGLYWVAIPKDYSKPMVITIKDKKHNKTKKYTFVNKTAPKLTKINKIYNKCAAGQTLTASFEVPENLRKDSEFTVVNMNPEIVYPQKLTEEEIIKAEGKLMTLASIIDDWDVAYDKESGIATVTIDILEDINISKGKYNVLISLVYNNSEGKNLCTGYTFVTVEVVAPKKISVKVPKNGATLSMDKNDLLTWNVSKKTKNLTKLDFVETKSAIIDGKANKFAEYFEAYRGGIYLTEEGKKASADELKANSRGYVQYIAYNGTSSVYGGMYVTINVSGLAVNAKPLSGTAYGCGVNDLQRKITVTNFVDGVATVYGDIKPFDGTENTEWQETWPADKQKGLYIALQYNADGFADGTSNIEVAKMETKDSTNLDFIKLSPEDDFCVFYIGEDKIAYERICIRVTDKENKEVEKLYLDLSKLSIYDN